MVAKHVDLPGARTHTLNPLSVLRFVALCTFFVLADASTEQNTSSLITPGSDCTGSENLFNCLTTSWQQCASGIWSTEITNLDENGLICSPVGLTYNMDIVYENGTGPTGPSGVGSTGSTNTSTTVGGTSSSGTATGGAASSTSTTVHGSSLTSGSSRYGTRSWMYTIWGLGIGLITRALLSA